VCGGVRAIPVEYERCHGVRAILMRENTTSLFTLVHGRHRYKVFFSFCSSRVGGVGGLRHQTMNATTTTVTTTPLH